MAGLISDRVLDEGLNILNSECDMLTLVSQAPTTYTEARVTYQIATKSSPVVSTAADRAGGGREVTVSAINSGLGVNNNGVAGYWALIDTVNSRLLAYGEINDPIILTTSDSVTLNEFTIGIPDPS